jgi:hypothetical protein
VITRLDTKDPAERKVITFDFANQLEPGVAIASTTLQVEVVQGTDPSPAALLEGAASLRPAEVLQRVAGGVSGAVYQLRCLATDASGLVHLVTTLLPVRRL